MDSISSATDSWTKYATQGGSVINDASNKLQAEMQKEQPNMGVVLEQQRNIQKGQRMLQTASNMLQTIHQILQSVIQKLQVR